MARVTVEDCAEVVRSRFELVALAAQRAKVISAGGEITVSRDNDKNAVIALREIADKAVDADALREQVIQARQTQVNVDEYGVEESDDEAESASYSAGEVEEDLAQMQGEVIADADDDLMYGGDDVEIDD